MNRLHRLLFLSLLVLITIAAPAFALKPPPPGMIKKMIAEGTYESALESAKALGNHIMAPTRMTGTNLGDNSPAEIAVMIQENLGRDRNTLSPEQVSKSTATEHAWLDLDLNRDGYVDERDLLVLGHYQPKTTSTLPSTGTQRMLCLLVDFSDFPHLVDEQVIDDSLFGAGQPGDHYKGLSQFYADSSNGMLNITGDVYGWYRAPQTRAAYCDDVNPIDNSTAYAIRKEIIEFALNQAFNDGANFSDYDTDGDGEIDEFIVIWSGWEGNWSSFWWGKHGTPFGTWRAQSHGYYFAAYSWQNEAEWSYDEPEPFDPVFQSRTVIHETGHSLGLADYYDYDFDVGLDGGVGNLDMMDYYGDHCAFSKYVLGWITPQIITTDNLYKHDLGRAIDTADAVILKPNFNSNPFGEYFIIEHRRATGYDEFPFYYGDGLLIMHANASQTDGEYNSDNSYTDPKLIRVVQADGLAEIEQGDYTYGDPGDFWTPGMKFGPDTVPNSYFYNGETYGGFCWVNADNTSTINLDVVCHNNLTGTVVDPQGAPMSGITINMSGVSTDQQVTGVDGSFAWIGAMGGTYTITPVLPDFGFTPASSTFSIIDSNVDLQFVGERIDLPKFSSFFGLNDGDVFGTVVGKELPELNVAVLTPDNVQQLTYSLDVSPLGAGAEDPASVVVSNPADGFAASFDLTHLSGRNTKLRLSGFGSKSGTPDGDTREITIYLFNILGDMNADGAVNNLDSHYLEDHLGISTGADNFELFCDSDLSGTITEADSSAIGYNWSGSYIDTYQVSGNVVDDLGSPFEGVEISFTGGFTSVTTDIGGNWTREGIPDGTYTATPGLSGWEFTPPDASFTVAGGNRIVPNFVGAVEILTYIASGHVEDSSGVALEGVAMSFSGGLATVTTDSGGSWTRDGVQDGTYNVTPELAGWDFDPLEVSFEIAGSDETVPVFTGSVETNYDETEDNDDLGQADLIGSTSFTGWLGNLGTEGYDGDTEDFTTFTASSAFDIQIDLLIANASTDIDIELLDSVGDVLSSSTRTTQHEEISELNLPPGTYYIRLFRWSGNDGTSDYTLDVAYSEGTIDMAYGYVVGEFGWGIEGVNMSFTGGLGPVTTNWEGYWVRSGIPDGPYTVTPSLDGWTFDPVDYGFNMAGDNVEVPDFVGTYVVTYDETENNDILVEADPISSTSFMSWGGNIGPGGYDGDIEDLTVFTQSSPFNIWIDLWIYNDFTDLDLEILDASGGFIAGSYEVTQHEEINVTGLPPGTYYISVYRYAENDGTADYELDVAYY